MKHINSEPDMDTNLVVHIVCTCPLTLEIQMYICISSCFLLQKGQKLVEISRYIHMIHSG